MSSGGVLVLDDDEDLLEAMGELIADTGRPYLPLRTLAQLAAARPRALACALAILDVNLGMEQPSGLDAFGWLRAEGFAGRVIFLTGHAPTHPLVERACELGGATVLQKPLSTAQMARLMAELSST